MSRFQRRNANTLAVGAVALSSVGMVAAGDIYKWVDENGRTHYSDTKPPGVKASILTDSKLSVIPGDRIGAEAARAADRERASANREPAMPIADETQARAQRR